MQRWLLMVLSVVLILMGCSGPFTIPKKQYRERVRTLGVVPLLLDEASQIDHPERDRVVEMLRYYNQVTPGILIDELKASKHYFDIRAIPGDGRDFFRRLVVDRRVRGEGDAQHLEYVFNGAEIASLGERYVVDGLLLLIFNGIEREETRWDRTKLTYLTARYNVILVSALVIAPNGQVLWEYYGKPGESFLPLQYPEFDEAYHNKTDEVKIRFITIPGLERTLAERETELFGEGSWPRLHKELYEELAAKLSPGFINPLRNKQEQQ
ncbi:MAG: hypothetical protein P8X63_00415 [Desulfuromonadaceae bacterium]|jgi:hypothetical protein